VLKILVKFIISDDDLSMLSEGELNSLLVRFLYSPVGTRYRYLFDVDSPISCGNPLPTVKVSQKSPSSIGKELETTITLSATHNDYQPQNHP